MIRLARKEDFEKIYAMYRSQVGKGFCVWGEEYPAMANIEFDYAHDFLYVYEVEGELLGAISIEEGNDCADCEALTIHSDKAIEIARVCIRLDKQGMGLATRMIAEFITSMRAKGLEAIQLLVAKSNPPAIRTYVRNGFIIKGEKFIYGNDYYIAELVLDDITIGEAGLEDLEGLLNLYTELHNNPFPDDLTLARQIWAEITQDKNHHVIVAKQKGEIISSVICVMVPNLTHECRPYALIENVITTSKCRGRGLATLCLNYAYSIAVSKNAYKLMLLTGSKEDKTLNFYRNAGYNSNDKTAFIRWIK